MKKKNIMANLDISTKYQYLHIYSIYQYQDENSWKLTSLWTRSVRRGPCTNPHADMHQIRSTYTQYLRSHSICPLIN